jgi:transposase
MSANLFLDVLGLEEFQLLDIVVKHEENTLEVHIRRRDGFRRCRHCGSTDFVKRGQLTRRLHTLPVGQYQKVFLVVKLHRLACRHCGRVAVEELPLSEGKRRYTKAFARYVIGLVQRMTIQDIAERLGLSWDVIKDIHKRWLQKRSQEMWKDLGGIRYLAIDEFAAGKGHRYFTVIIDLDKRCPLWIGQGRSQQAVAPFFKMLKDRDIYPLAVAMDMWSAYTQAVMDHFPMAAIVYDRFHIIANANKVLDEIRRLLRRELGPLGAKHLKGMRWILLKGRENLAGDLRAQQQLERLVQYNEPLYKAYLLKEELRDLFHCKDPQEASARLDNWIAQAHASGVVPLKRFANTLAAHRTGILNYFRYRISTGPLEGLNNKIKVLKRKAYGYRDEAYFKLRVLFIHEAKHVFVG